MRKIFAFILLIVVVVGVVGCNTPSEDEKVVNVYNWGDYIDKDILNDFEEEYGIRVNYETYPTNEDLYVKISQGTSSYDVIFPSDYMVERMVVEDLIQPIDLEQIPNFENIDDNFKDLSFDPNNEYSVPYTWGTLGILYNTEMVDEEVKHWDIMWDEQYKDEILMYDSQRDTIAVALKKLGYSMNSTDPQELEEAKQALIDQKEILMAYVGDNVRDMMINEEAAIALVWSGEAVAAMDENENLDYVIPEEGSNIWFDNMVIPSNAENYEEAHTFINYILEPEVSKKIVEYVGYSIPNEKTMALLDDSYLDNRAFNPSEEELERCEIFEYIGESIELYNDIWTEVKVK